ncbi:MAG: cbb3-type cytochrome c oxidase subunit I [Ignavibacteriota bacterium]
MVGTRNVAFPRLNASATGCIWRGNLSVCLRLLQHDPRCRVVSYPPLSGPQFSPGKGVDVWAQMITFTEVSSLCVAVELVVTILKMRAPGMSLNRMPMFCWSMLVQSFMIIFAMPAVMIASTVFLLNDRTLGTHFVNPAEGGDPLLYQHVFWFFGHPEVYIIFLPALGMVSAILETHFAAPDLRLSGTGTVAGGQWLHRLRPLVHHMFATRTATIGEAYFTAASMMIAITSGVQIFCWLATLWSGQASNDHGRPLRFRVHLHFRDGGMTASSSRRSLSISRLTTRFSSWRIFTTC